MEQDGTRRNKTERGGTRRNETERDGTRRNKTEQDGTRRNKTEQDGTKRQRDNSETKVDESGMEPRGIEKKARTKRDGSVTSALKSWDT